MTIQPMLLPSDADASDRRAKTALFMSGGGSNAEKILDLAARMSAPTFDVCCLVTDRPEDSRAEQLGEQFGVPVVANDIRAFHRRKGLSRLSLRTEEGREAREAWTEALRRQLAPYAPDFGVLAGFIPLTNLVGDFPCLNVHPGDLTVTDGEGRRVLVGLHTRPVERAICRGLDHLRSSVILAEPYSGGGDDMDSGPILGLSPAVPLDLQEHTPEELANCLANRSEKRPKGGFDDPLEQVAKDNLQRLKEQGDWTVLPRVVADFAAGRFARDDASGGLFFRSSRDWLPIETVVYEPDSRELLFRPQG